VKVTKKSNGETYNAEMIEGVLKDEGGLWELDDPEFRYRNGQQLHEQYMMGIITIVSPVKQVVKAEVASTVLPSNFMKKKTVLDKKIAKTAPKDGVLDELDINFDLPKERKVEMPTKKRGRPKGVKKKM